MKKGMKKSTVILLFIVVLLLAACGGDDPEPTAVPVAEEPAEVAPTEAPAEMPTETAVEEVAPTEPTPDPALVGINWQWERREQSGSVLYEVNAEQGQYMLFFKEDGTFSVGLDCNNGSGNYTTGQSGEGSIEMTLGPVTMAECGPDSHAQDMANMFGPAQGYRFEEDGAVVAFVQVAGGPVDYYRDVASISTETADGPLDTMEHVADPELIDKTWAWERRDPNGNTSEEIIVNDSENYTLVFNEDGTFSAKMDCNNANGQYATGEPFGLFMELGPSTAAFCGEESLDTMMAQTFGPAQSYRIEGNGDVLVLVWVAGGPLDYYRNVSAVELSGSTEEGAAIGSVIAPDGVFLRTGPGTHYPYVGAAPFGASGEIIGVSQDNLWWLFDAPSLPEAEIWAVAEYIEASGIENVPVVAAPSMEATLVGTPWMWVSTADPAIGHLPVVDYMNYIIVFNEDGSANIQADCNAVQATYTTDGSSISIVTGPSTMVACGDSSQDSEFLAQLSNAAIYFVEGGNLFLDMTADSGTMRFAPEGMSAPPTEDAPAGEADGSTLYVTSMGAVDAPQPLIEGSQISASFTGDQISGNASCNNYSGTMVPVEDHFTITGIVTTRQFCDGLMDQEQAYLTALESVDGYQWEQQLFYIMSDGSVGVINFSSTP